MGTNQSAAYAMILKRKSTQRPVEEQLPESKRAKTLQDRGTKGTEVYRTLSLSQACLTNTVKFSPALHFQDDVIDLCNSDDEDPPQTRNVESKTAANVRPVSRTKLFSDATLHV